MPKGKVSRGGRAAPPATRRTLRQAGACVGIPNPYHRCVGVGVGARVGRATAIGGGMGKGEAGRGGPRGAAAGTGAVRTARSNAWSDVMWAHRDVLRDAYRAALERFASTLRPAFESGELRGYRDGDDENGGRSPFWTVEALAATHFGVELTCTPDPSGECELLSGDEATAHLILAVSPHAASTGEGAVHVCAHAMQAVAWDVVSLARERGWYVPEGGEYPEPASALERVGIVEAA